MVDLLKGSISEEFKTKYLENFSQVENDVTPDKSSPRSLKRYTGSIEPGLHETNGAAIESLDIPDILPNRN